jgi:hypothetical protein
VKPLNLGHITQGAKMLIVFLQLNLAVASILKSFQKEWDNINDPV